MYRTKFISQRQESIIVMVNHVTRSLVMAVLGYLKCKGRLPDPKGSLSLPLPSSAIAAANLEVMEATSEGTVRSRVKFVQVIHSGGMLRDRSSC